MLGIADDGACDSFSCIAVLEAGVVPSLSTIIGIGMDDESTTQNVGFGASQFDDVIGDTVFGTAMLVGLQVA